MDMAEGPGALVARPCVCGPINGKSPPGFPGGLKFKRSGERLVDYQRS